MFHVKHIYKLLNNLYKSKIISLKIIKILIDKQYTSTSNIDNKRNTIYSKRVYQMFHVKHKQNIVKC